MQALVSADTHVPCYRQFFESNLEGHCGAVRTMRVPMG